MITRKELVAHRLSLAMKSVDLGLVFSVTFDWRIRAILEKSKWEEGGKMELSNYYYLDYIDFLMVGKWSENERS